MMRQELGELELKKQAKKTKVAQRCSERRNCRALDKNLIKAFQLHPLKIGTQMTGPNDGQETDAALQKGNRASATQKHVKEEVRFELDQETGLH